MELKTFRAVTPAAALKKAQEVCGEDAMVVSTKQLRKKTLTQDAIYEIVVVNMNEEDSQKKAPQHQEDRYFKPKNHNQPQKERSLEDEFKNSQDILVNISEAAKQISKITNLGDKPTPNKYTSEKALNKKEPTSQVVSKESIKELEKIKEEINKLGDTVNLLKIWFGIQKLMPKS